MPPPELLDRPAPASAGQLVLEGIRAAAPVSRHTGPRAEEAYWRARINEHRGRGDTQGEREASVALARLLASRGVAIDQAAALARRALAIADDAALRTELAGWLAGLGEPALAAAALRGVCDPQRPSGMARTLVKIAVLLARASDAAGAVDALDEAGQLDPADAMASELLGTISAWASEQVFPEAAARAYLEAAKRREAAREREAAFEDRLRAFEIAPHEEVAAKAMAAALFVRGRHGAADEAMRVHAASLVARSPVEGGERAAASMPAAVTDVHRRRIAAARKEEDAARAVGAVLDAMLEADVDAADAVDEVLGQAGLYELVAARLELRADHQTGLARSETYEALARLYTGPLASPDRAVEAWIEAAASDPGNSNARAALREHAATLHDMAPLAEALIRLGEREADRPEDAVDRAAALRELASLAEDKLADPALARWAFDALKDAGEAEVAGAAASRLAGRLRAQEEAMAAAQRALRGADTSEGRIDALRRLVVIYRGRPTERAAYQEALAGLARALPADRGCLLAFERLCRRTGDGAALDKVIRERLAEAERRAATERAAVDQAGAPRGSALTRVELVRIRLLLSAIDRRCGDEPRALDDVMPLLVEAPGHRGAASAALLLATRVGRARARADALVQLAGPVWPGLRAVLLALAAELYAQVGEPELARKVGVLACEADPSCARAVAVLAAIVSAELGAPLSQAHDVAAAAPPAAGDRAAAAALERAITMVLPRSALCDGLARALEALGELPLSLAWTQRWLALRPGSPYATRELIRRAALAGDAARLSDALAWVLAQPKPLGDMVETLCDALHALFELDPARAAALARRSLDVFGPRIPLLRERLLELARRAQDAQLAVTVLERWLGAEASEPHAVELMLMIADCRIDGGDLDGAARGLARVAAEGADAEEVISRIHRLETVLMDRALALGSDGAIALAEAKALSLTARGDPTSGAPAIAWRELGSLLWDLAEDRRGAEQAFFQASQLATSGGIERYARDLSEFCGFEAAIEALVLRASEAAADADAQQHALPGTVSSESRRRAHLLIEAATLASEHGQAERALAIAEQAIGIDPSRADAVALVEKCAHAPGGIVALDRTYRLLAAAALGCYGRRAAHYRAARQLERRGAIELALAHAVACFEAVPAEGTAYVLLARLAERAGDPSEAVGAIERVAAAEEDLAARNAWLKRAATLAGRDEEGVRLRLDILLRALSIRPDAQTVGDIGAALKQLIAFTGETDVEVLRFERAVNATLAKLDGPDGARAGLAMAKVAVEVLSAPKLALAVIERAMLADGDIDEFDGLIPMVAALARETEPASHLIAAVYAAAKRPHASVGPALLCWASKLASALNVPAVAAELLVEAVRRAPDDDNLADMADAAVRGLGDDALKRALDDALPVARRLDALLHLAEKHERDGEADQAVLALQRALSTGELSGGARDRVVARLRHLFTMARRTDDLIALLQGELARADLADGALLGTARELAGILTARGDHKGAMDVLVAAALKLPPDRALLDDLTQHARRAADRRRLIDVLTRLAGGTAAEGARLLVLRELAPLVQELGDRAAALAHYEEIARLDPEDTHAIGILEQDASERGDHAAVASLLARRIAAAPSPETRRALRLRRAAVLEQRLGLLDDACAELDALLAASPGDVSALRFLADIHERLGAPLRAAPLWRKLGRVAASPEEKAEYGLRACSAYLGGGDTDAAKEMLGELAPFAPSISVSEFTIEIARREGDNRALAAALDRLADASEDAPERRAQLLVEAARATSLLGDDVAALERARRAVKLTPDAPEAVLEARRLEYRLRGTGTPRDAQAALEDLNRVAPWLDPEDVDLHAFLTAETLDVIQGHGAGMRELTRRHAEVGPSTLLALGMAERLALKRNFAAAVPLFQRALGGDLRGMRARGRVALAAALTAQSAGDLDAAARLLEEAAAEQETRALAVRRQLELTAARGDPEAARGALEALAAQTIGLDRGRALCQLARLLVQRDPDRARRLLAEASELSGADRVLVTKIADVRADLEAISAPAPLTPLPETLSSPKPLLGDAPAARSPAASPPPAAAPRPPAASPSPAVKPRAASASAPPPARAPAPPPARAPAPPPNSDAAPLSLDLAELNEPLDEALTPPDNERRADGGLSDDEALFDSLPSAALAAEARAAQGAAEAPDGSGSAETAASGPSVSDHPPLSAARLLGGSSWPPVPSDSHEEATLFRELGAGANEAGDRLIALFEGRDDRSRETLAVRRMQAHLRLGDRGALERLRDAALADRNPVYARAIEHVLHAFAPAEGGNAGRPPPAIPPLLTAQRDAPDLVNALLFRDLESPVNQALALVWETGLYRREPSRLGLTGVERVQPTPATVVGEVYGAVAGRLGLVRTALFHHRGAGPLQGQVMPITPPAVVVRGEIREDTPELRYVLGAHLAGAMPEHVLVNALPADDLRTLVSALVAAFGPLDAAPRSTRGNPAVVRLEQNLWQLIPPRAERRLREICVEYNKITYDEAVSMTRAAMRRAGLFAAGSLATAVHATLGELGVTPAVPLSATEGLAAACAAHAEVADLVRLATRMEYAEARWQPGPVTSLRRAEGAGSRFRAGP